MKQLQVNSVIKALLIFLGIIGMQIVAYFVCAAGYLIIKLVQGMDYKQAVVDMAHVMLDSNGSGLLMWVSAVTAILSFIWCVILYNRSSWRVKGINYREVFSASNMLGILSCGVGGCILLTLLLTLAQSLFPSAFAGYAQHMSNFDVSTSSITLIYVVVIGPISEETIFRGAIFDRFHLGYKFFIANILQALLFGIYHFNLVQGIYAFLLGLLLGMIVYATGSILASIVTHMLFNATSYVLPYILTDNSQVIRIVVLALIGLTIFAGLRYFINICREKAANEQ